MYGSSIMLKQLQANKLLRDQEELNKFIEALKYIRSHSKKGADITIDDLVTVFDDRAVNTPPLDALVGYIHTAYTQEEYSDALLRITPNQIDRAKHWLTMFYSGVIFNQSTNGILKDRLLLMTDTDNAIKGILRDISGNIEDYTITEGDSKIFNEMVQQIVALL